MSNDLENSVNFFVIVAIGAAVAWYDERLFAVYAFMAIVGHLILFTGRIWKLLVASNASTNAKLLLIAKRVGVRDADYDVLMADLRKKHPKAYEALVRAGRDVGVFGV